MTELFSRCCGPRRLTAGENLLGAAVKLGGAGEDGYTDWEASGVDGRSWARCGSAPVVSLKDQPWIYEGGHQRIRITKSIEDVVVDEDFGGKTVECVVKGQDGRQVRSSVGGTLGAEVEFSESAAVSSAFRARAEALVGPGEGKLTFQFRVPFLRLSIRRNSWEPCSPELPTPYVFEVLLGAQVSGTMAVAGASRSGGQVGLEAGVSAEGAVKASLSGGYNSKCGERMFDFDLKAKGGAEVSIAQQSKTMSEMVSYLQTQWKKKTSKLPHTWQPLWVHVRMKGQPSHALSLVAQGRKPGGWLLDELPGRKAGGWRKRSRESLMPLPSEAYSAPELVFRKLANPGLQLSLEEQAQCLLSCVRLGAREAEKASDKDLLMLIGNTGAGKSTFINYLHGCEMEAVRQDGANRRLVQVRKASAKDELVKIGHSSRSETFLPQIEADENFTYCDCPGFLDNRGAEINVANAVSVKAAVARASSVKVVVMINYYSLEADRGRGVRDLLRLLADLFGSCGGLKRAAPSVALGVSRAPPQPDGEELTLEDLRRILLEGRCSLSQEEGEALAALSQNLFLYHPMDGSSAGGGGGGSWAKRGDLIQSLRRMPALSSPRDFFHTVLTLEDERALRGIVGAMEERVLERLSLERYEEVASSLTYMCSLDVIDSAFVSRLLGRVKMEVNRGLRGLEEAILQKLMQDRFDEADSSLDQLAVAGQALKGIAGIEDASEMASRARAYRDKRRKEAESLRLIMDSAKNAADRAAQLDAQVRHLEGLRQAESETFRRLAASFAEGAAAREAEVKRMGEAYAREIDQTRSRLDSSSEEQRRALLAEMERLKGELTASLKLHEVHKASDARRMERTLSAWQARIEEHDSMLERAHEELRQASAEAARQKSSASLSTSSGTQTSASSRRESLVAVETARQQENKRRVQTANCVADHLRAKRAETSLRAALGVWRDAALTARITRIRSALRMPDEEGKQGSVLDLRPATDPSAEPHAKRSGGAQAARTSGTGKQHRPSRASSAEPTRKQAQHQQTQALLRPEPPEQRPVLSPRPDRRSSSAPRPRNEKEAQKPKDGRMRSSQSSGASRRPPLPP